MRIECKLKREGGTNVELDGRTYEFRDNGKGEHVCEVDDDEHLAKLLAIPEGYRLHKGPPAKSGEAASNKPEQPKKQIVLLGSDVHQSHYTIGETEHTLGALVGMAADGMNAEAWNLLGDGERADRIDAVLDGLNEANEVKLRAAKAESDERDQLVAQYTEKFGKAPHHNAGVASLKAKLAE